MWKSPVIKVGALVLVLSAVAAVVIVGLTLSLKASMAGSSRDARHAIQSSEDYLEQFARRSEAIGPISDIKVARSGGSDFNDYIELNVTATVVPGDADTQTVMNELLELAVEYPPPSNWTIFFEVGDGSDVVRESYQFSPYA